MVLLTGENIRKSYGTRVIFDDISFSIHAGDKIGVVGINGAGKSTLLRIVSGEDNPDQGEIITANHMEVGYLSQTPNFVDGTTVLQQIFVGENPKLSLVRDYEKALEEVELFPQDANKIEHLAKLTEEMDKIQGWSLKSEAKNILTRLGIENFNDTMETLSGGQRKRVALAAALIAPVELLILDEPTNHIDHETVEWLENHLEKYGKALLMVTHDRYFLDRVANKILELDKGKIYSYDGNYSMFLDMKAQREELEVGEERKRQNLLRTELEWVRRGAKARTTKQKARLQRYDALAGENGPEEKKRVELSSVGSRLGKKTIELDHISKSYGDTIYIDDFSYIILRDDRIGITGNNGCGKSTLINMITGSLAPDTGTIAKGDTVKVGVFAQENQDMNPTSSVLDYMKEEAEYIETAEGKISASQMLEKFLFPQDMQRGPISMLSGGEKRRLYLARMLLNAPNILFLDEPTNDLDIETLMILEEYLDGFQGAVIVVSHDRYFLDKVVNRMFAFTGNGKIKQYEGGYSDYKLAKEEEEPKPIGVVQEVKVEGKQKETAPIKKLSYKDQREYDTIGEEIGILEEKLEVLNEKMVNCITDYTKLQHIADEKKLAEEFLEIRMERWMELMELVEEIEKNCQ